MPNSKVVVFANIYAVNDGSFNVPPRGGHYHTATCRMERDLSVLIMLGHMHEYGKHYRLEKIDENGELLKTM